MLVRTGSFQREKRNILFLMSKSPHRNKEKTLTGLAPLQHTCNWMLLDLFLVFSFQCAEMVSVSVFQKPISLSETALIHKPPYINRVFFLLYKKEIFNLKSYFYLIGHIKHLLSFYYSFLQLLPQYFNQYNLKLQTLKLLYKKQN